MAQEQPVSTFDLTLFRRTSEGLKKTVFTIDQSFAIVGENTSTVSGWSVQAEYPNFMNAMLQAGKVGHEGIKAERIKENERMLSELKASTNGNAVAATKTAVSASTGRKVNDILSGKINPCTTERCKELRAQYEAELNALQVAPGGCRPCERQRVLSKYQNILLQENVLE